MNLLHNELEDLLKPGTIVAHYKREEYLKLTPPTEQIENMYLMKSPYPASAAGCGLF